mgnify:CR=1 FL=1
MEETKKTGNFLNYLKELTLRVPLQEKVMFARHLSIMTKAGMSLIDALTMLQKQTKSRSFSKILEQVVKDVSQGQFLADSFEKYKNIFDPLFINIIRVGETGGILSENLNYLSEELKKKSEMRKKVIGALIYPIIILVATLGITALLTIFIFPKILPVFTSLNINLPATTKLLIAISNLLTEKGFLSLMVLVGIIFAVWLLTHIRKVKFTFHWLLLKLPIVSKMSRSVNMTNFSRTLGLLLKSDIKIVEALNITADTLSNLVFHEEIKNMAVNIQKGEFISKYLLMKKNLFPPMLANMVAVGENTGNLSETLLYLSEFYESEVSELTKNLATTMEPILMLTMGIIVGFVALSIITPIYQVTQTVGR